MKPISCLLAALLGAVVLSGCSSSSGGDVIINGTPPVYNNMGGRGGEAGGFGGDAGGLAITKMGARAPLPFIEMALWMRVLARPSP